MGNVIQLNHTSINNIRKLSLESQARKSELAQALTTDGKNAITAKTINPQKSSSESVSYTSKDLYEALEDSPTQWVLFHTHLQDLNHANVHSQQDEKQHAKNAQQYSPDSSCEIFDCLGNGIIGVRKDGGFSIKARSTQDNDLIKFAHDGVEAEELVFDKEGNMIWHKKESTLDPEDNKPDSWDFDPAA